jgi:uncharacterized integral membrane protein
VLILFGILIFQNQDALVQKVELKFFRFQKEMILGFWILFTFAAGALFAMAFDFWRHLGLRWEILRKNQELQKLKEQAQSKSDSQSRGAAPSYSVTPSPSTPTKPIPKDSTPLSLPVPSNSNSPTPSQPSSTEENTPPNVSQ